MTDRAVGDDPGDRSPMPPQVSPLVRRQCQPARPHTSDSAATIHSVTTSALESPGVTSTSATATIGAPASTIGSTTNAQAAKSTAAHAHQATGTINNQ